MGYQVGGHPIPKYLVPTLVPTPVPMSTISLVPIWYRFRYQTNVLEGLLEAKRYRDTAFCKTVENSQKSTIIWNKIFRIFLNFFSLSEFSNLSLFSLLFSCILPINSHLYTDESFIVKKSQYIRGQNIHLDSFIRDVGIR